MRFYRDGEFIAVTQADEDRGPVGVFPSVEAARHGAAEVLAARAHELDDRFTALRLMLGALFDRDYEEQDARGFYHYLGDIGECLAFLGMDLGQFVDACGPEPISEERSPGAEHDRRQRQRPDFGEPQ